MINPFAGTERSDAASEEFRVQRIRARPESILRECLRDEAVHSVLAIGRTQSANQIRSYAPELEPFTTF